MNNFYLFSNDYPNWINNFLETYSLKKIANQEDVLNQLKKVPEFNRFFIQMTEEDKKRLDDLERRFKKGRINEYNYTRTKHTLKNKFFYPSNLFKEFYLYQLESLNKADINKVEFAKCSCGLFYHDGENDPFTISAINKCDINGTIIDDIPIFKEVYTGTLSDYLAEVVKRTNFNTTNGEYLFGLIIMDRIDNLKEYVESEIIRIKKELGIEE